MTGTKALDSYFRHEHFVFCSAFGRKGNQKYPCNCGFDQASAELAQLKNDNKRLTDSIHALRNEMVKVRQIFKKTIDQNTQLRAELDEASKDIPKTYKIMHYLTCYGDANMVEWANEWISTHRKQISAHPEETK